LSLLLNGLTANATEMTHTMSYAMTTVHLVYKHEQNNEYI